MTLEFESEDKEEATYNVGENPLDLFIEGDTEMRGEILLNHPDVTGFIYLNDDVITKAFLPKKMVNFKNNTKVIISVSGDTEDFTAISVHDKALLGDSLHLTDSNKFSITSAMVQVGKHLKDNAQDLPDLPKEFSTEARVKKLSIIAFPLILPLVKGYKIPEGDIDDDETYDELCKVHEVYADWAFLQSKKYILNQDYFPWRK